MALDPNIILELIEVKLAERRQRFVVWFVASISCLFLFGAFYVLNLGAPAEFRAKTIVTIEEKSGLNQIAQRLYEQKIIKSPFWFRIGVITFAGQKGVMAGDYYFEKPVGILSLTSRLVSGDSRLTPVKVTFPEGMTSSQMSTLLENNILGFNTEEFLRLAKLNEGYNFPDTYLFMPNIKPEGVMSKFKDNFTAKINSLDSAIKAFKKPLKDVVTMASIVEAEARTTETRKIVAGILWKRLSISMPLQVDAPFQYIIGKNTFQLTTKDLKFDSPYNTYLYRGLPPGPIGNPGLDALTATLNPVKTDYFYYLSDVRGNMHYAKTFAEHVVNKEKYLR